MTIDPFRDPDAVAGYAERAHRTVPGLEVLHRLCDLLLREAVADDGRLLVVGAGGGLELAHLAARHPGWRFDGVDPSREMLRLAELTLGSHAARAKLHEGYVHDAPIGPFDAATCLLTLHFIEPEQRLRTLRAIRERLRPGAPLLTFHHSVPAPPERAAWLQRSAAYAVSVGSAPAQAAAGALALEQRLPLLTPDEDAALLEQAGYSRIETFYAALTFRGWIAHA